MIKNNLIACFGEVKKQHRNYHNSLSSYMSVLIWPILNFVYTYFIYQSFDISSLQTYDINSSKEFIIFLITGSLVFNCFWSMVQSAFFMTLERQNGTIEISFLSPASRLALMYGRALGGMITNMWMFCSFSFVIVILSTSISIKTFFLIVMCFFIILLASTIWGGFINSLFLISRDSSYLFTICDEPMNLFSGAKIPIQAFPLWGRIISSFFPATYCISIIRSIFLSQTLKPTTIYSFILTLIILVIVTKIIIFFSERNNRKKGNLQFY